jgi:hypothetical protein
MCDAFKRAAKNGFKHVFNKNMKMAGKNSVKYHETLPIIVARTIRNYFYDQVEGFYRDIIIHFLCS